MSKEEITASVLTLGCRVNQYESDVLVSELKKHGIKLVPFGEKCDVSVVNTCTVTAESDRKSRQMIRKAAAVSKHVAVTGCFAQISSDEAMKLEGVEYVCGNSKKASLAEIILKLAGEDCEVRINDVTPPDDYSSVEMKLTAPNRTRSYIKIEDGCNNRCSYCIINKARGPVRSKDPSLVLEEAEILASQGCREVILTGIEAASYGMDFKNRAPYGHALADLIAQVSRIGGIERIGLGSLEPSVMSDYFCSVLSDAEVRKKVLPHFHISLQSGSSEILAKMRRRYNAGMALAAMEKMRTALPESTFSADVIVGFPTETEENFIETVKFCEKAQFLHLHIFPYSKRAGTEAAAMAGQIPEHEKKLRLNRLEEVGEKIKRGIIDNYIESHREKPVYLLTEKCRGKISTGHSEHFIEVKAENCTSEIGEVVPVLLESYDGKFCVGRRVECGLYPGLNQD
ncbi:MAG: tRNA (N(6)-L-threonylcarbamoyladenosine(37)-C(2))-methylthiotransferase MtaB [Eubacteriales bacterium]